MDKKKGGGMVRWAWFSMISVGAATKNEEPIRKEEAHSLLGSCTRHVKGKRKQTIFRPAWPFPCDQLQSAHSSRAFLLCVWRFWYNGSRAQAWVDSSHDRPKNDPQPLALLAMVPPLPAFHLLLLHPSTLRTRQPSPSLGVSLPKPAVPCYSSS